MCTTVATGAFGESHAYDASGRLTKITQPNGQSFYYRYDRAGNLLAITTDVITPVAMAANITVNVGGSAELDIAGGNPMGAHTYFASGLPPGLRIDPLTGRITGYITAAPGTYRIAYWATAGALKSAVQYFNLVISAFPASMVGAFDALMTDVNTGALTGRLEITVSAKGGLSGKLLHQDGKSYGFNGVVTAASDNSRSTSTVSMNRVGGLPPLTLDLTVLPNNTFSANLAARRIPLCTSRDGSKRAVYTTTSPAPWKGTYTMALDNTIWTAYAPEGIGYASVTISSLGQMSVIGKTADGATINGSMYCNPAGVYLTYLRPYLTEDSYLAGWLKMVSAGGSPVSYKAAAANGSDLYWKKAPKATDKGYRNGFGPLEVDPLMLKWTPTTTGQTLASKLGLPSNGVFGATIQNHGVDSTGAQVAGITTLASGSNMFITRSSIPAYGGTMASNNLRATKETGEPNHNGNSGGASMWWSWTPAASGAAVIHTEGSNFDTVLAMYTGSSVNALTPFASDDDGGYSNTSLLQLNVTAGTTYQIAVDGYSGRKGNISLTVYAPTGGQPLNYYGVPAWLSLNTLNKIGTAERSSSILTGSVNAGTGVFTTTFAIKDRVIINNVPKIVTRTVPFNGVFLMNNSGGVIGGGYFLLPPLASWDTTRSGGGILTITPPRAAYP